MKLSLIIEALREISQSFGGRVGGAAEFKAIDNVSQMQAPAAYVVPTGDNAGEQKSQTDYDQLVTEGFAVIVALDNRADQRGQNAYDSVNDIRAEIWAALLGWEVDENTYPIKYEGGQVISINRELLYYQFDFSAVREVSDVDTRHGADLSKLPPLKTVMIDFDYASPGGGPDGEIEHHEEIHFP
ncbi:hypothetical protein F3I27_21970 [Pantoea sp. Bo_2]|uniref:Phage protein n=1 Tax=Candidatus Pantoea gossypiicola TaxID=2608008 RepID=A0AB34CD53_9GAMM|nr:MULTISPECIES: hypothetical protein [Pantoea]KAA5937603.1 hypothetical protein F3I57_21445 [Pantoea sp. VH_3]KAA5946734.1 hypothetical protein F3I56_22230 [Pantoea sp. VH_25]KAA5949554.1 hypothetical protein F3I55_22585 [Pantoea sp. VH_24]KAA5957698.1 hypothetical protein F3I53_15710 [Pantoea sp. VH_16]KAA5959168.1 hypothetical protein F3I54_22615 [Pantoea sp. VH_18]